MTALRRTGVWWLNHAGASCALGVVIFCVAKVLLECQAELLPPALGTWFLFRGFQDAAPTMDE